MYITYTVSQRMCHYVMVTPNAEKHLFFFRKVWLYVFTTLACLSYSIALVALVMTLKESQT